MKLGLVVTEFTTLNTRGKLSPLLWLSEVCFHIEIRVQLQSTSLSLELITPLLHHIIVLLGVTSEYVILPELGVRLLFATRNGDLKLARSVIEIRARELLKSGL